MELVTALNDDPVYRKKIETCREQTEEGKELSEALVSSGMFTGVYARMVSIGAKNRIYGSSYGRDRRFVSG